MGLEVGGPLPTSPSVRRGGGGQNKPVNPGRSARFGCGPAVGEKRAGLCPGLSCSRPYRPVELRRTCGRPYWGGQDEQDSQDGRR